VADAEGVVGVEHAVRIIVLEVVHWVLVMRRHQAILLEHADRGSVVPRQEHEHRDALAVFLLRQLAERIAARRLGPLRVPEQRDLRPTQ
jgi:hypothetical protein